MRRSAAAYSKLGTSRPLTQDHPHEYGVRFGSLADILRSPRHVRFTPNNGQLGGTPKSAFGCRL